MFRLTDFCLSWLKWGAAPHPTTASTQTSPGVPATGATREGSQR